MTTTPTDLNQEIMISVYLRRDKHENGMTLQEYADAIIAGTQPVLDQDAFVYQFGSVEDEINLVEDWATTNELTIVESGAGIATVKVQGTAEQFNNLFKIQLETVVDETRTYITHKGDITIPSEINSVVEMILGLNNSIQPVSRIARPLVDPTPSPNVYPTKVTVNPVQVATAYQLPAGNGYGQTIAIIEFQGSGWNQTDVNNTFGQISGLSVPSITNYLVNGATASTTSDAETIMDIWCAGGVAPKAKQVVYFAPLTNQGFYDNVNAVANDSINNPSVLSVSWGYTSEVIGDFLATPLAACVVKGILVFFSSGDDGGNNWVAEYPSTSSYAISAGGTSIYLNNDNTLNAEVTWTGSGGGHSTIVSLPSWQASPTLYYTTYSSTGIVGSPTQLTTRGVPDISAPADPYTGYQFYVNGILNQNGGTSASAPFLAGMFTRLNALLGRRIQFGELMNLLYGTSGVTTDITSGQNNYKWHAPTGTVSGYKATTGWDAATGLGSPIGTAIYKLLNTGTVFPATNVGFRPTAGQAYPRLNITMEQ
jgi:kumamolisin